MSQHETLNGSIALARQGEKRATASRLTGLFDGASLFARLDAIAAETQGPAVFTTSFGLEDQAIAHAILSRGLPIDIVTIDTGRLFPETYDVWAKTEARYVTRIRAVVPRHEALEALVSDQGIDGFYGSLQARKACCNVRKVEPLARALSGAAVWVTGLRGDQSDQRKGVSAIEVDEARGLLKANPLFDWSRDEVLEFTAKHGVPVSALHAKGFLSIGCAPAPAPSPKGSPNAPEGGGGRTKRRRNAGFTSAPTAGWSAAMRRPRDDPAHSSAEAGSRGDPHHPRGRRDLRKPGDALLHRQGLGRAAAPCTEGLLSRSAPLPAAACRHHLEVPRDDRVPRPTGQGTRRQSHRPHQRGWRARRHQSVRQRLAGCTPM